MRVLARIGLLLLFCCFCAGAMAKDDDAKLQVGFGVVCDTSAQMERYLTLYRGDISPETALRIVNSEANNAVAGSPVCGMASIAFAPGGEVGTVNVSGGMMHIMQITVVAMKTHRGWFKVPPTIQYTAMFEELTEA